MHPFFEYFLKTFFRSSNPFRTIKIQKWTSPRKILNIKLKNVYILPNNPVIEKKKEDVDDQQNVTVLVCHNLINVVLIRLKI